MLIWRRKRAWILTQADVTGFRKQFLESGIDQVFDCIGSEQTINESLRVLRTMGRFLLIGTAGNIRKLDLTFVWFRELYISGSAMYSVPRKGTTLSELSLATLAQACELRAEEVCSLRSFELALRLLTLRKLQASELITNHFQIDDYKNAFRELPYKCRAIVGRHNAAMSISYRANAAGHSWIAAKQLKCRNSSSG